MKLNDVEVAKYLIELIDDEIVKYSGRLKYMKAYPAIIVAVGTGVADVKMAADKLSNDDNKVLKNIKDKTHETLAVGDNVYLVSPTNNLSNAFIAWKF